MTIISIMVEYQSNTTLMGLFQAVPLAMMDIMDLPNALLVRLESMGQARMDQFPVDLCQIPC